jgi:hypothetical protein
VRRGRGDAARRELEGAVARAAATGPRLNQALTRLARGWALTALDDPDAGEARAEAHELLAGMGLPETEWDAVFRRAAGLP